MKKIISIIMLLTFVSIKATEFSVYEANYPNVKDYNVKIDDAILVIQPAGNYVEFNLYMTVSYDFQSWFFKNYNELEFLWQFNLPEEAIVHEFWYWEGDSIIAAQVLDKWTAELLFNNVSNPVRNPGLLTQSNANYDGQVQHQLKLFPIKRGEKRKFRIQYLLPGRPTGNNIRAWLPMTQLISDKTPGINKLKILYLYGETKYEPKIIGTEVLSSKDIPDLNRWGIEIPIKYNQFVEIEIPSPIKENVYFTTFERNGENYYHLAVYPPEVPRKSNPRNVLFVIDYNRFNTKDLDGEFLLSYLKESIQQAFSENDSINVIAAYDNIVQGSTNWVSASKDGIDELFKKVMLRSFPSYNNLLPLITKATEFINSQNDSSEVLFITNTNSINIYNDDRIQLADQITSKFKAGTKIHFFDLDNKGYLSYNNGFYETQMQSFYGRIAHPNSGNLFFLRYNTLKEMIYSFLYDEISHFESVEVQMRFQQGYAHSKHFLALHEGYYPLHTPIMQIGIYEGKLPVNVTVFGKYKLNNAKYTTTLNESDVVQGNNQIATTWFGSHIKTLLKLPYSPLTISDIINLSLEQKILTPYTGFLVFQPDENHGYCEDCEDNSGGFPTAIEEKDSTLVFDINAFPNPFNPSTTIKYILPENGFVSIKVYNILGEAVDELVNEYQSLGSHTELFNGSSFSSGMYILTISYKSSSYSYFKSKKLLLLK